MTVDTDNFKELYAEQIQLVEVLQERILNQKEAISRLTKEVRLLQNSVEEDDALLNSNNSVHLEYVDPSEHY